MYIFNEISSFVPALDIAAGAFSPQKKAVPDFLGMSKVRNLRVYVFLRAVLHAAGAFFFRKKGDPGFLRPLQHAAGAFFLQKTAIMGHSFGARVWSDGPCMGGYRQTITPLCGVMAGPSLHP